MKLEIYEANVSGAIYDFAAYLTTMDEAYTVGAQHNATRMADEVQQFLARRGIDGDHASVQGWQDAPDGITGMEK